MIRHKIDVLEELKQKGYNSYRLRKDKLLGEKTIYALRHQQSVSFATLDILCKLLECQVEDIIYHTYENE